MISGARENRFICNRREAAVVFGVTPDSISAWIMRGMPIVGRRGRELAIDLRDAIPWRFKQLECALEPRQSAPVPEHLNLVDEQARLASERADSQALANAELRRRYVTVDDAAFLLEQVMLRFKLATLAVPGKAATAVKACGTVTETQARLQAVIDDFLLELAALDVEELYYQARGTGEASAGAELLQDTTIGERP